MTIFIPALSHLVAASLKEDTIGVVQRDIPRILEALLSFLAEAETYQQELEKKMPTDGFPDPTDLLSIRDVARAIGVVAPIVQCTSFHGEKYVNNC